MSFHHKNTSRMLIACRELKQKILETIKKLVFKLKKLSNIFLNLSTQMSLNLRHSLTLKEHCLLEKNSNTFLQSKEVVSC